MALPGRILEPKYERCLVIIKPEHFPQRREIWEYLDHLLSRTPLDHFFGAEVESVPRATANAHCIEHRHKPWYNALIRQYAGKSVSLGIYEGDRGLIKEIRRILGDKDPEIARMQRYRGEMTVRGKFSDPDETLEKSIQGRYGTKNVIHASADVNSAIYETSKRVWGMFFEEGTNSDNPEDLEPGLEPCLDELWRLLEEGDALVEDFYREFHKLRNRDIIRFKNV